tara:strand:+ start:4697 stop:5332 length:636 start_codon:yes stop_codon:yes gene_type:complete
MAIYESFENADQPNSLQQGPVRDFFNEEKLIPIFKALHAFTSKDKDRPVLAQVELEFHEREIYATATDGHSLLTVCLEAEHLLREHPVRFTVTAESVKAFVDTRAFAPLDSPSKAEAFPPVRQVFPSAYTRRLAAAGIGQPVGLCPFLFKRAATALMHLGLTGGRANVVEAEIEFGDPLSPVTISVDDFLGSKFEGVVRGAVIVLMPKRLV